MPEDAEMRRQVLAAIRDGRRDTARLMAQWLPDDVIMRIWERRAGLRWDEELQRHVREE